MLVVVHQSGIARMTTAQYAAIIRLLFGTDSKVISERLTGGVSWASWGVASAILRKRVRVRERDVNVESTSRLRGICKLLVRRPMNTWIFVHIFVQRMFSAKLLVGWVF
jgi:hypothetical protein